MQLAVWSLNRAVNQQTKARTQDLLGWKDVLLLSQSARNACWHFLMQGWRREACLSLCSISWPAYSNPPWSEMGWAEEAPTFMKPPLFKFTCNLTQSKVAQCFSLVCKQGRKNRRRKKVGLAKGDDPRRPGLTCYHQKSRRWMEEANWALCRAVTPSYACKFVFVKRTLVSFEWLCFLTHVNVCKYS